MHSLSMVGQMAAMAGRSTPCDRLQAELRHDHQRAGIAGGHRGVGAAVSHRFERKPHARMIAALAQRLARLRVHGDGDVGVDKLGLGGERGMGLELGLDAGAVADQQEAHVGMADQRDRGGRNDHAWPVVPAHGVERYGDWSTHYSVPIRKTLPMRRPRPRQPPEMKPE